MKCKTVSLEYESGFWENSKNRKKSQFNYANADSIRRNPANGWTDVRKYSHYWLTVETEQGLRTIDIRRQFGEHGIRLIERIRALLQENRPTFVEVNDDLSGIDQETLKSWIDQAGL